MRDRVAEAGDAALVADFATDLQSFLIARQSFGVLAEHGFVGLQVFEGFYNRLVLLPVAGRAAGAAPPKPSTATGVEVGKP